MNTVSENIIEEKGGFSFKKSERLCSKKAIDKLFSDGETFLSYPLKVGFIEIANTSRSPAQAAFTVGKRNFKSAIQRNLIKRKLREAYRLNKNTLYKGLGEKQVAVFFIFIGKETPDYMLVESAMKKAINKLLVEIDSNKKT